jgi:hypothetical protein
MHVYPQILGIDGSGDRLPKWFSVDVQLNDQHGEMLILITKIYRKTGVDRSF